MPKVHLWHNRESARYRRERTGRDQRGGEVQLEVWLRRPATVEASLRIKYPCSEPAGQSIAQSGNFTQLNATYVLDPFWAASLPHPVSL